MPVGLILGLVWAGATAQVWATARFPSHSRWCLAAAVALFALSATLQLESVGIDRLVHAANVSLLLGHLSMIAIGAAILMFLDTNPGRLPVAAAKRYVPAAAVMLIYTTLWVVSDIHAVDLHDAIASVPEATWQVAVCIADLYIVYWAAILAFRSIRTVVGGQSDASSLSLVLIGLGAGIRVVASSVNIFRIAFPNLPDQLDQTLRDGNLALASSAACAVAGGAALAVLSNGAHLLLTYRKLRPLWVELTSLTPEVVLRSPPAMLPGSAIAFRATRQRAEIIDSLYLLHLDTFVADEIRVSPQPEIMLGHEIASRRLDPHPGPGRAAAAAVLPQVHSHKEEVAQLRLIADGYRSALECRATRADSVLGIQPDDGRSENTERAHSRDDSHGA